MKLVPIQLHESFGHLIDSGCDDNTAVMTGARQRWKTSRTTKIKDDVADLKRLIQFNRSEEIEEHPLDKTDMGLIMLDNTIDEFSNRRNLTHVKFLFQESIQIKPPPPNSAVRSNRSQESILEDGLKHPFRVPQNISVPKSQDSIPLIFKPAVSFLISLVLRGMLATVTFNDDASFIADEVDNISSDRFLPSPFQFHETFGPEATP